MNGIIDVSEILLNADLSEERKGQIKILVAEDDAINQKVVTGILGRLGYRIDISTNGKEAVKALEQTQYDLVLMDCQMPEMDGYEATEMIRDPGSKVLDHKIPVIALTGHAMDSDMEKCINAGMDDYLSKPVKPAELTGVDSLLLKLDEQLLEFEKAVSGLDI